MSNIPSKYVDPLPTGEPSIVGKKVNDMYGSRVGKAIGTTTTPAGRVTMVGVDCDFQGVLEVPYEHVVVQDDCIIYVPKWRIDAQRILREKGLIMRRMQALTILLKENDQMIEDAEAVKGIYDERMEATRDAEAKILEVLADRLQKLNRQKKSIKAMVFDAAIRFKSNEIREADYKAVKSGTSVALERLDYEISEINNMRQRLSDADKAAEAVEAPPAKEAAKIPPPPSSHPGYNIPAPPPTTPTQKSDWISRMNSQ